MSRINYHHLNYFWHVARVGNLTKVANTLHVSQSSLSIQIKQLEESIGNQLFVRQNRKLSLTDVGKTVFSYAESIFSKGDELEAFLKNGAQSETQILRVGMLSTMSRNFVEQFVNPLMNDPKVKIVVAARGQTNLLQQLSDHEFDVVLTNIEVRGSKERLWQCQKLSQQPVSIIGAPGFDLPNVFNDKYNNLDWVLPLTGSPIRAAFDGLCSQNQFRANIIGEADDMAMLRLLARDSDALAVMPKVVVRDEINAGNLSCYLNLPNIYENFYAVTVNKHIANNLVSMLIKGFT
jgi:LysR family transcriptional regulator, transcriptional activator of nhaA